MEVEAFSDYGVYKQYGQLFTSMANAIQEPLKSASVLVRLSSQSIQYDNKTLIM